MGKKRERFKQLKGEIKGLRSIYDLFDYEHIVRHEYTAGTIRRGHFEALEDELENMRTLFSKEK